jgi:guanine deaminase
VRFISGAEVVIDRSGRIVAIEEETRARARHPDFGGPVVIMPGFVDAHVHLPQFGVRGRNPGPLLDWLDELIFPVERRFGDPEHARAGARAFQAACWRLGSTAAGIYVTPQTEPTRIALEELRLRGAVGKVLMDREGPPELLESADSALGALRELIDTYGQRAAIVPRFAVSCSNRLLAEAGALASETGRTVMTHLAENQAEVERVRELFPDSSSYTSVYAAAGLLGPRTLLAHCIHLSDDDLRLIASRGSVAVHCPTANRALGSGRMPVERLRALGVRYVLGSDVGAGPSLSMWHVIAAYLEVHAAHAAVSPEDAFWRATLGGARALGIGASVGSLDIGKRADLAVFPLPPTGRDAASVIRALAEVTFETPEPAAISTWMDGVPIAGMGAT